MVAVGGVGAAETVLVTETVESQEREPVDDTLALDEALLHTLPLREGEPLPELLRNEVLVGQLVTESVLLREGELLPELLIVATTEAGSVAESVAHVLTEAVLQSEEVIDPHDEALGLCEVLPLPLPLREEELQPELLRVATPVRLCVGDGVAQELTEGVLQ
jgi:hypothetical protein